MNQSSRQLNIPKLRFPGFDGVWEEKRLGEVFENSREKGNEKLPIFSVTINNGLVSRDSLGRKIENASNSNDNLYVGEKYLVYNMMRMWQGAVGIANRECMVSPAYVVLKPEEKMYSDFFINYFGKERSLYLFGAYSYGLTSDRLRLYYKDFARIKFYIPKLPEQQKIADFLGAVDEWVGNLKSQKEKLEGYKKGMMQRIFSQEIRFRADNGGEFPEWEEKRLGEVFSDIKSGKDKQGKDGEFSVYGSTGVIGKSSNYTYEGEYILVARVGANAGRLNRASGKFGVTDNTLVLDGEVKSNINFIYSALQRQNLKRLVFGSGQPLITGGQLKRFKLKFPSLPEQQKIADFLTSIDDLIEAKQKEIEKAVEWKRGLGQNLFV